MDNLIVDLSELVTSDFDIFLNVTYKGKPFTGKAYEKKDLFYSEYSYLNGYGHGKCFTVYSNGIKMEEFELHEGNQIGDSYYWFENGQLKQWDNDEFIKNWDRSGALLRDYNFVKNEKYEYYSTGELMISDVDKNTKYYTKSNKVFAQSIDGNKLFNEDVIDEFLDEICEEVLFSSILKDYINQIIQHQRHLAIEVLCRILNHENLQLVHYVVSIIGFQNLCELKQVLQTKLSDKRTPETIYDRYDNSPKLSYSQTIAESAALSLKRLK